MFMLYVIVTKMMLLSLSLFLDLYRELDTRDDNTLLSNN